MTFVNVNPRKRRKNNHVNPFFTLVNDVMNTSFSELEKSIVIRNSCSGVKQI